MAHRAKKIVIITEKLILPGVAQIIERCGGTGYTVVAAGGKGRRNLRPADRLGIVDEFTNVKVEVITSSEAVANRIADEVAAQYFADYSGITYMEDVEVLRPRKFAKDPEA